MLYLTLLSRKEELTSRLCFSGASVVRRSADAITNLAHENVSIKSKVRSEDGIPPLVTLLEAYDPKVCL